MNASAEPFAPLLVTSRGSIVGALKERREALGWTCEQTDGRAGWADRYLAKLEHPTAPQGRAGFHFAVPSETLPSGAIRATGMSEIWLETLGLRLVLVDAATAESLGARPAPPPPRGGSACGFHHRVRRRNAGAQIMTTDLFAAAVKTQAARDAFAAMAASDPALTASPELQEKAEAVQRQMAELIEAIGDHA